MRIYGKLCSLALVALLTTLSQTCLAADRTFSTDIAVIGGGSSGLSAALAGAQAGAKVIVLEKNPYMGGSSNFAEGLFAVESDYQKAKSYGLSKDEAFKHIMEFAHYKNSAPIIRNFVNASADNINWLHDQGIDFEAIQISPNEPMTWHIIKNREHFVHGSALVTALQHKAAELGVTFLTRTPAEKLIYEGDTVTGVEAIDHKGNTVIIKAKAVIVATGGFGNSKEKIKKWTKYNPDYFKPTLPLNKTGDGIQMAKDVGATTEGEELMLHIGTDGKGIIPLGGIYTMTWQPTNMWVNSEGKRFVDEMVTFSFTMAGTSVGRQNGHYAWAIFDEGRVNYAVEEGVDNGVGVIVKVATKLTSLPTEIKNALAAGSESLKAADTIEGLAKEIGVPVSTLKQTYNDYNRYAENHYDVAFAKEHRWMQPLTTGKLYAVKVMPYHFVSIGGIRINTEMEAIDENDQPVAGLYAVGCDVGGLYGDTYTLWASGHAFGFATYSGRLAGMNAAAAIK